MVLQSSSCKLGEGSLISFWHDNWSPFGRLSVVFPTLFSFASDPECTVLSQFDQGVWALKLHPNLSSQANSELEQLLMGLESCHPSQQTQDTRLTSISQRDLSTSYFYKLLTFRGVCWQYKAYVWNNIIPLRHRIFLWLAFRGRLNTRDNMVRKHWSAVAPVSDCELCPATETISHIILRCRPSSLLWYKLELSDSALGASCIATFVEHVHQTDVFGDLWCILFAACAVSTWQARNDRTFNSKFWTPTLVCYNTAELLKLWSHRARRPTDKNCLLSWAARLLNQS